MICSYLVSGSGIGIMFYKSTEELEMDGFSSFLQASGSHHLKERKVAEKPIILIPFSLAKASALTLLFKKKEM